MPGSGEDRKVRLTAYEEPGGDIDGDIIDTERTKPGDFVIRKHTVFQASRRNVLTTRV